MNHQRADYASLHGDGVTLDVHICEKCRQDWPCDAYRLEQLVTFYEAVLVSIATDYYHDRHAIWAKNALDLTAKPNGQAADSNPAISQFDSGRSLQ
ncbi:MAG TPA: hypothetical protein VFK47_23650 [Ktedonobacteraceae bacterium]|nr:hypothetical protein [Ktedonobacteraceae bacterium]